MLLFEHSKTLLSTALLLLDLSSTVEATEVEPTFLFIVIEGAYPFLDEGAPVFALPFGMFHVDSSLKALFWETRYNILEV